jgi:hypothetical protein
MVSDEFDDLSASFLYCPVGFDLPVCGSQNINRVDPMTELFQFLYGAFPPPVILVLGFLFGFLLAEMKHGRR